RPAFEPGEEQGSPSPERRPGRSRSPAGAAQLEREVQRLLAERSQAVRRLLMRSRQPLDRLVERLMREETVDEAMLASALRAPARP
ncbi:MAG TPA: hypothetical protein DEP84_15395, partial [Chloroflexi bacterium]|nr:hypothetical protein [Chloroflexota bacterium]